MPVRLDNRASKLSFHLRVLKQAGLLANRQEDRWIYYRLRPEAIDELRAWLSVLDRFLPLWILLAMAGGLLLGRFFPAIQGLLDAVTIGRTSLPIGLGLLLLIYPWWRWYMTRK